MFKHLPLLFLVFLALSCAQKKLENRSIASEIAENNDPHAFSFSNKSLQVFTTAANTALRLAPKSGAETWVFEKANQPREDEISVFVNTQKQFQTFIGIGGAITDASAEVFAKLPPKEQEVLLKAYYSKNDGIGYNIVRTSIHSCDFSSGSFTYITEGDETLESFDIEHDRQYRIPLIKAAKEIIGQDFLFYASPWSPPAFMKDNNNMLQGGKLLPKYFETWATYYTKFIAAYEAEGIAVWGITVQNEPMATQRWESCIYTAEEERDFLKNYLGPIMEKAGFGNKNIVVWDHNRDLFAHRANTIFSDAEAAKYAWGIGHHWYETWTGGAPKFENIDNIQESFPDKKILFTEGCNENFDSSKYQYWPNAERYGLAMINDFNNGTVGWTDWNILLDETGGPNHVGNLCFAPVHANTQTGKLIFTPSFYYIGHFSKFVRPNAKRLSTTTSRSPLQSTSFINEDGSLALIVMNQSDTEITYRLFVDDQQIRINIEAHAMQTVVLN